MSEREDDFATIGEALDQDRFGDPTVTDADRALARIQAHVEVLEGALRQASECCARPAGVCFDRAALTGTTGQQDTWVRTRTEGVNDQGQPFVEFRGTRTKGENDEEA